MAIPCLKTKTKQNKKNNQINTNTHTHKEIKGKKLVLCNKTEVTRVMLWGCQGPVSSANGGKRAGGYWNDWSM
jgi:hypothetical protein